MFPGLDDHPSAIVGTLNGYCNFAAIYRRLPEGLKIEIDGIDDAQHAILQKLAWKTVSRYPYAGIEEPNPKASVESP